MVQVRFINDTTPIEVTSETQETQISVTSETQVKNIGIKSSGHHEDLTGRDLPNQHPISAITGLENALETKVEKINESNKVYGTDDEGLQTTYDLDSFGHVDDVRVDGVSVVSNKIAEIDLTGKVDKTTTADQVYGTNAQGQQTTYSVDSFGKVDDVLVNGTSVVSNKIANVNVPTAVSQLTNDSGYQNGTQVSNAIQDSILDSVQSTSTTHSLSANMGKELQDEIDNLKARGRFLALWNCATGLAKSNPPESPYVYQTGDYFIVGIIDTTTNYRPDGSSYTTGVASQIVETAEVNVDDVYYYDGTNWKLQQNTKKTVTFANIAGSPYDNSNLASALNDKQDTLTAGTDLEIVNDVINFTNNTGYITGIDSQDVVSALGYTPYNSSNPSNYQENVIETIKVNGTTQTVTNKTVNITVPDSATWGNITGTLSDQTDLNDALDAKQNLLTSANAGTDISITSSATQTVSGINSISLPNAKANSLDYVNIIGATEQNGTPAPNNPIDIICNNGVLKVKNLFDVTTSRVATVGTLQADGSYLIANMSSIGVWTPSNRVVFNGKPNTRYTISAKVKDGDNITVAWVNSDGTITQGTNRGTHSEFTDVACVSEAGKTVVAWGMFYGTAVSGYIKDVQIEYGSTATAYVPYGQIYADGTQEIVTDSLGNTASAEMLFKIGDYKDVQSIIDGIVTRNIGVKVLDGTESWSYSYSDNAFYIIAFGQISGSPLYCTHFKGVSILTADLQVRTGGGWGLLVRYNALNGSASNFKQYLADQYNAGTPVIIVYPLATATTETVTGQTLTTQKGNNTISITQSAISNLSLNASYELADGSIIISMNNESGYQTSAQVQNAIINSIVDNTSSTSTTKSLSANMGKVLQDEIDNLKARGRFLALWDCSTGLAESNPQTSPYTYSTGDYFIVGTVGATNYRPNGSTYTIGVASSVVETQDVAVDDVYYYDGSTWKLQVNTQKTLAFSNIAGSPYDNTNLTSALNEKLTFIVGSLPEATQDDVDKVIYHVNEANEVRPYKGFETEYTEEEWAETILQESEPTVGGMDIDLAVFKDVYQTEYGEKEDSWWEEAFDVFPTFTLTREEIEGEYFARIYWDAYSDVNPLNDNINDAFTFYDENWEEVIPIEDIESATWEVYYYPGSTYTEYSWATLKTTNTVARWGNIQGALLSQKDLSNALNAKQATLVSGTNIKTINNNSILGSGDLSIETLPSQSGQSGKFLTTDGTDASWDSISIPTVNDATLTITRNNVSVGTFTANASSNATINISVPTDTNDLTNGAGFITSSELSGYQTTSNLVTSVSSSSTDSQYPSAKLFYDTCGDIEATLNAIRGV